VSVAADNHCYFHINTLRVSAIRCLAIRMDGGLAPLDKSIRHTWSRTRSLFADRVSLFADRVSLQPKQLSGANLQNCCILLSAHCTLPQTVYLPQSRLKESTPISIPSTHSILCSIFKCHPRKPTKRILPQSERWEHRVNARAVAKKR